MRRLHRWLGVLLAIVVLMAGLVPLQASTDELSKARNYYLQNRDKTLSWADDILAVESIGLEVEDISNGFDVSEFLEQDFASLNAGALGKAIIAICLMEMNPRDVNGVDLVAMLEGYYQADGSFASKNPSEYTSIYSVPFDVLALKIVGSTLDMNKTVTYFTSQQDVSGAFGYEFNGFNPDFTGTGWAMMALHYLGEQVNVDKIKQYLNSKIDAMIHGWSQYGAIDANTQASVLWSLYEVEGKKYSDEFSALMTLQTSDGGFKYNVSDGDVANAMATQQAMLALGVYYQGSLIEKAKAEYTKAITPTTDQTITSSDGHIIIKGDIPQGTTINSIIVNDTKDIENALQDKLQVIAKHIYVLDMNLVDKNNAVVQPNGIVLVQVKIPDGFKEGFTLYRQEMDGTFTKLAYQMDGEYVIFETSHFSKYIFVEETNIDTQDVVKTGDSTAIFMSVSMILFSGVLLCRTMYKKKYK